MAAMEHDSLTTAWYTDDYSVTTDADDLYEYDEDYPDELCNSTDVARFGEIFHPVFFSLVVALSLLGNTLVLVILAKYENLRSLTNIFILNLAVSDLIFTLGLPFWAYYYMYGWTLGEPACKAVSFIFYVGYYSSGILLIMMTVHRYVAVTSPLSGIVAGKGFYSFMASIMLWTLSALSALPALIFSKVLDGRYCDYEDFHWKTWGIYQQNIIFLVTFLIFGFSYSQILWRLLGPAAQKKRDKTLKLICILIVVFFVGWAPYNIVLFLKSLDLRQPVTASSSEMVVSKCNNYTKPLEYALYVSQLVAFSHCCLNPVFYVFVGVKFKSHLKRMLTSVHQNRHSFNSRASRATVLSVTSGGEEFSL